LLLAVVANIDTGFDLLTDDPSQCRLADLVAKRVASRVGPYVDATTLEGAKQTVAQGPVASQGRRPNEVGSR
jgi:hypothetical protein